MYQFCNILLFYLQVIRGVCGYMFPTQQYMYIVHRLPYSGFISREKIFANFADLSQFAKILFANIACVRRARLHLLVPFRGCD